VLVLEGRVFFRGRLQSLALGIDDGRIVAVRKVLEGDEVHRYGDALILPGCVDLHVHFREPGFTHKEDFASGTRSAALGGVTTIMDMPNTDPPVTTRQALEAKASMVRGRSAIDYGLYAAPRSAGSVARLADATAFKVYMAETTGGLRIDAEVLPEVLEAAGELGKVVAVHAEDEGAFRPEKEVNLISHDRARPKEAEVRAVQRLRRIRGPGPLHVAHVTCVEAIEAVPAGVTTETTPHHLLLDHRHDLGAFGKVNPPLRGPEDRDALWRAFVDGRIDAVASDHAPHTEDEKREGPFDAAPAGVPGVATSFPLLLRKVKAGDLSLERLVATMATRPAAILGVEKGAIAVGRDADLIVVDPRRTERVTSRRLRYKCGWTPFEGLDGCFPQAVYVRGEAIVEDGELAAEGFGRPITVTKR